MPTTFRSGRAVGQGGGLLRVVVGGVLTCLILIALLAALLWLAPLTLLTRVRPLPPTVMALYGSLRDGRADLANGYSVEWTTRPTLAPWPAFGGSWMLSGSDTRIDGTAHAGVAGIVLRDASGRAGPGLAQLVPGAWSCDMTAIVADVGLSWGWRTARGEGRIETPAGSCTKGARDQSVPPLTLELGHDGADATARLTRDGATPLADLRLARARRIDVTILPAAADVFPALPRGGPIELSLPF